MEYPWYDTTSFDTVLMQGDFIPECPIVIPPNSTKEKYRIQHFNTVVLSQSCDLVANKIDIVLVSPYYPLKYFIDNLPEERNKNKPARNKVREELRKNIMLGYHLLDKDSRYFDDYQVVDLKSVYGVKLETLKSIVKPRENRIRLLPPYREHLSQSFAYYFMRVGLPQDISFEKEFLW